MNLDQYNYHLPEELIAQKAFSPRDHCKLLILKNCDGKNSILEISKKSGIKLSTVSTYITQLRNIGLLTTNKKPKRSADNIVLNLGSIQTNERSSSN